MAGFNLAGSIGNLFDPPKLKRIPWDTRIDSAIPGYVSYLTDSRSSDVSDLAAYSDALKSLQPAATRQATEDVGLYSNLIDRNLAYDPQQYYRTNRDENLAGLEKLVSSWSLPAALKTSFAAAGLGDRGNRPGSYEVTAASRALGNAFVPVANTIFSNLGRDASGMSADRLNNVVNTVNLAQTRADRPYLTVDRILDPLRARGQSVASNIASFGGLSDIARENVAGLKEEKSFWEKFGDVGDNMFNSALSLYGGGFMGGGGGGGAGGAGGIAGMMGGSGAGGGNMDWMKMIQQMFGGGGGGQSSTSTGTPGYYWNQQYNIPGVNTGYPGFN